jgi:hypothetical protein
MTNERDWKRMKRIAGWAWLALLGLGGIWVAVSLLGPEGMKEMAMFVGACATIIVALLFTMLAIDEVSK